MLNMKLFLNDIYYWGSTEILTYAMTKRYLEDIDFALNTEKAIRFNQRSDRLYLDLDGDLYRSVTILSLTVIVYWIQTITLEYTMILS